MRVAPPVARPLQAGPDGKRLPARNPSPDPMALAELLWRDESTRLPSLTSRWQRARECSRRLELSTAFRVSCGSQ